MQLKFYFEKLVLPLHLNCTNCTYFLLSYFMEWSDGYFIAAVPGKPLGWFHLVTAPDHCFCLNQASLTCNKGGAGEFPVGKTNRSQTATEVVIK